MPASSSIATGLFASVAFGIPSMAALFLGLTGAAEKLPGAIHYTGASAEGQAVHRVEACDMAEEEATRLALDRARDRCEQDGRHMTVIGIDIGEASWVEEHPDACRVQVRLVTRCR